LNQAAFLVIGQSAVFMGKGRMNVVAAAMALATGFNRF